MARFCSIGAIDELSIDGALTKKETKRQNGKPAHFAVEQTHLGLLQPKSSGSKLSVNWVWARQLAPRRWVGGLGRRSQDNDIATLSLRPDAC